MDINKPKRKPKEQSRIDSGDTGNIEHKIENEDKKKLKKNNTAQHRKLKIKMNSMRTTNKQGCTLVPAMSKPFLFFIRHPSYFSYSQVV